jgi:hypothetical protein
MNRNILNHRRCWCLISLVLVMCAPAAAQWKDNMGGSWNNPTSASIGNIINDQLWNRMRAKARARDKGGNSAPANISRKETPIAAPEVSKKTPAQIDAAVSFRSTGTQLRTKAFADFLSADGTPETKQQMPLIISALLTEYEKAARAQGKPNDLALATTAALVYNSSIYNDTPDPEDARIMELRDALAELAIEDGIFTSMTDRQKQELYENLVISTMLAKVGYEEAKKAGDKTTMAAYRTLAGQTLQAVSGLPPEKVDFSAAAQAAATLLSNSAPVLNTATTPSSAAPIEHWVLLRAYGDNSAVGAQQYNGKRVTITGPVDFVRVENGKQVARMSVPMWSGLQMFCIFPASQKAAVDQLLRDQRVVMECTVRGEGGGYSRVGNVDLGSSVGRLTMDNCILK